MNTNHKIIEGNPMKTVSVSFVRRLFNDQQGQTSVLIVLGLGMVMLGVGGFTADLAHFYVVRSQLQNSVNAAGLAAAGSVYNTNNLGSGINAAKNYVPNNPISGLTENTGYPAVTTTCLNLLMTAPYTCANTGNVANAVIVTEQVSMPTWFMGLFGIKSLITQATATASMQGVSQPWNVVVIVDTTGSMATVDSNCGTLTELQCALSGVQTLLANTPPCGGGITGANCTPAAAQFRLSLFTFPNILTSVNGVATNSLSNDLNCNGSPASYNTPSRQPIAAPYTLPKPGAVLPGAPDATYLTYVQTPAPNTTWTATYQITPFLSDYSNPSSTATGGLNAASQLVQAIGYTSSSGAVTKGCLTYTFGIDGYGTGSGFGNTYFASAIYAAQSALTAEAAAYPGSQNAIIFLSDGQANASEYTKNSGAYTPSNSNQQAHAYEFPEGPANSEVGPSSLIYTNTPAWPATPAYYTPAKVLPAQNTLGFDTLSSTASVAGQTRSGTTQGTYPDWYDQCQQAILAGYYAANTKGSRVYSVAYGSEASGCGAPGTWSIGLTDTVKVATGTYNQPFASAANVLPCTTMEDIASSWSYFYSDNQQAGNVNLGCTDLNHTSVSLQDIFLAIEATFTTPRLLPNNAT
jgi:hypothetical protein